MTQPERNGGNRRPIPAGLVVVIAVCLLAPFVALLWVSSYAKAKPTLWGFPFFYWYQFLWVFITAALTYAAYRIVGAYRRGGGGPDDRGGTGGPEGSGGPSEPPAREEVPL